MYLIQNKEDDNIMHFKNDDDFYEFCVNPSIIINECNCSSPEKIYYQSFDFTKEYQDAVNAGKQFMIHDEDSKIYKRGAVSYKTMTKNVQNLVPYYDI